MNLVQPSSVYNHLIDHKSQPHSVGLSITFQVCLARWAAIYDLKWNCASVLFKSQCWRRGEGDGMRWTLNKFTSIVGGMDTHLSFKLIKESSKMENCFSTLQVTESYRRLLILHVGQHYAQSMRMTSLARCVCVVRFSDAFALSVLSLHFLSPHT